MECMKIEGPFNNYEEEINRIIKEKREENMYIKDVYLENQTICMSFSLNESEASKQRNIVVQGNTKKYESKQSFIKSQTDKRRNLCGPYFITWGVVNCLEIDGRYILFLKRKRRGYHRKKRKKGLIK